MHPNSADVDTSSVRYQFYDPELFDEYEREDENTGKQNTFVRLGSKYEVVNDPRKSKKPVKTDEEIQAEKDAAEKTIAEKAEKKRLADEEKAAAKDKADAEKAEKKRLADEEKAAKRKPAANVDDSDL